MRRLIDHQSPKAISAARYIDERDTDGINRVSAFLWLSLAIAAALILACLRAS